MAENVGWVWVSPSATVLGYATQTVTCYKQDNIKSYEDHWLQENVVFKNKIGVMSGK